eukprot:GILI01023691.1.p1 GENE.GILI01023691.1~~GILI01023691.1.p1  ORF type:complete len:255 (-),score=8.46 GILI01023691.1:61-801(-)
MSRSLTPNQSRRPSDTTYFSPNFRSQNVDRSLGRRLAPSSAREQIHTVHSGIISSNGTPLTKGKGRCQSPSVSRFLISPTPLAANEKADPLMLFGPTGTWVSRGVRAATPPPTRIQRESGKAHLASPESINIFHQKPLDPPLYHTQTPLPSDIPGLTSVSNDRTGAGSGVSRGLRITGPVPFVPPPFEKRPYQPQKRQVETMARADNDVLLQRPVHTESRTPIRSGLRSVTPTSTTRYNIITNDPI